MTIYLEPVQMGLSEESIAGIMEKGGKVMAPYNGAEPLALSWPMRNSGPVGRKHLPDNMQFLTTPSLGDGTRTAYFRSYNKNSEFPSIRGLYLVELAAFSLAAARDLPGLPVVDELRDFTLTHLNRQIEAAQEVMAHLAVRDIAPKTVG